MRAGIRTLLRDMAQRTTTTTLNAAGDTTMRADGSRAITINDNSLDTRDIFIDTREVIIAHGNDRYRLRLTAQNKLILTK
jgi:hemin uptake protein HemP